MPRRLALTAVLVLACLTLGACTTQLFEGPPRDDSEVAIVTPGWGTRIKRVRSGMMQGMPRGEWVRVNGSVRALPGYYVFELKDTAKTPVDLISGFRRDGRHGEVEAELEAGERYVAEWDEYDGGGIEPEDT